MFPQNDFWRIPMSKESSKELLTFAVLLNRNNISQYCSFRCVFDQINISPMIMGDFFQQLYDHSRVIGGRAWKRNKDATGPTPSPGAHRSLWKDVKTSPIRDTKRWNKRCGEVHPSVKNYYRPLGRSRTHAWLADLQRGIPHCSFLVFISRACVFIAVSRDYVCARAAGSCTVGERTQDPRASCWGRARLLTGICYRCFHGARTTAKNAGVLETKDGA